MLAEVHESDKFLETFLQLFEKRKRDRKQEEKETRVLEN